MAFVNQMFRSKATAEFVREEVQRDGKITVIRATLPIGRGWQSGNGSVDWINLGWRSADEYDASKHKEAVETERKAEEFKVEKPEAKEKKAK